MKTLINFARLSILCTLTLLLPLSAAQAGRDGGNGPRFQSCSGRDPNFLTTQEKRDGITAEEASNCMPVDDDTGAFGSPLKSDHSRSSKEDPED